MLFYFLLNTDISNKKILKSFKNACVCGLFYANVCNFHIGYSLSVLTSCIIYTTI